MSRQRGARSGNSRSSAQVGAEFGRGATGPAMSPPPPVALLCSSEMTTQWAQTVAAAAGREILPAGGDLGGVGAAIAAGAPCLVDLPMLPRVAALGRDRLGREAGQIYLLVTPAETERAWREAAEAGLESVVQMPVGGAWLAERLVRQREVASTGEVVVVGASRGALGATTVTALLGAAAATAGAHVLVVDGAAFPGPLAALLGIADADLGWPAFVGVSGSIPAESFAALPSIGSVQFLGWPNAAEAQTEDVPLRPILVSARNIYDIVFLDLPVHSWPRGLSEAAPEKLVLLADCSQPAMLGARSLAAHVQRLGPASGRLLLRTESRRVDARGIAGQVGWPLLGVFRTDRRLSAAEQEGRPLATLRRSRSLAAGWLADLTGASHHAPPAATTVRGNGKPRKQ